MVNYKNIPAFFKILPDLLRIPDIIRNFAGDYEKDRSCQGTGSWHTFVQNAEALWFCVMESMEVFTDVPTILSAATY